MLNKKFLSPEFQKKCIVGNILAPHRYQMAALKRLCHLPTPIVSCNQLIQHISEKQIAKEARMKENILDLRVVHVNMVKNVRYQGVAGNTTMTNVLTLHNTFVQQK